MEQNPQQSPEGFTSEDEEATYCLSLLRDGDRHQKIVARERLSQIFERRGLLDEAAQCLESNIREGVRDPRVYQRLAGVYRRQGRHELADEVLLEARRLAERMARSQPAGPRRPGRPGRPGPAGPPAPAAPPPNPLEAPTATMPSVAPVERSAAPAPVNDFDFDPVTIGMGAGPVASAPAPVNRPWWVSPAMVVVLVLLFGPFGLALMWVNGGYAHATKVRVASIWGVLMVVLLAGAAVGLQSQMGTLLAGAAVTAGVPRIPGVGVTPGPIVFGPTPAAGVGAKPTLPPGLAPAPPQISASPGVLATRPGGTTIGPGPGAEPTPAPSAGQAPPAAEPKPSSPPEKPEGERVKVADTGGGGANLRERPGQGAPVIKTVPEGTILRVVGADQPMDGKSWKNVRDDSGAQGWMAVELLEPAP